MDENLSRGYVQLNQGGQRTDPEHEDHEAPRDNYQLVYLGLLLAGVGFLLPYNSFIIACDYFEAKYPSSSIVFDMSLVYILVAFGAVCVNNALVEALAFTHRIAFGYFVSFTTLLFVLVFEVGCDVFSKDVGYTVNLIAVAVVAFGCTVQQSSFYGYTSMLPARYTQAVMTGESAAGLLVSGNRILTKLLLDDERVNTILFFLVSTCLVLACVVIYSRLQSCAFVAYYVQQCRRRSCRNRAGSLAEHPGRGCLDTFAGSADVDQLQGGVHSELLKQDSEDVTLVDTNDEIAVGGSIGGSSFGDGAHHAGRAGHAAMNSSSSSRGGGGAVLAFQSPPASPTETAELGPLDSTVNLSGPNTQRFGIANSLVDEPDAHQIEEELANYGLAANQIRWLSNNVLSLEEGRHRFKVQDVVVKIRGTASTKRRQYWTAIKKGAVARVAVARSLWPYMLSISLAYCVTLSLFPGIESKITSCRLHSWMPVILMAVFNASDFVGKMVASLVYSLERSALVYLSLARVVLVPLLALCALPGPRASVFDDAWAMFLSLALGLSNGVLGSVPMIVAPSKVPHHYRELTGNMMTLSYSAGLTAGSLAAYLIKDWVGTHSQGQQDSCDGSNSSAALAAAGVGTAELAASIVRSNSSFSLSSAASSSSSSAAGVSSGQQSQIATTSATTTLPWTTTSYSTHSMLPPLGATASGFGAALSSSFSSSTSPSSSSSAFSPSPTTTPWPPPHVSTPIGLAAAGTVTPTPSASTPFAAAAADGATGRPTESRSAGDQALSAAANVLASTMFSLLGNGSSTTPTPTALATNLIMGTTPAIFSTLASAYLNKTSAHVAASSSAALFADVVALAAAAAANSTTAISSNGGNSGGVTPSAVGSYEGF